MKQACVFLTLALLFLAYGVDSHAAEANSVSGVVTNVNPSKQTITVRNDANNQRRTYFLGNNTRLMSKGVPIPINRIKRGNSVTLRYRETDRGREVVSFRVPNPNEVTEVVPVQVTQERQISGTVTGVRSTARTITIRSDETRRNVTLKIPEDARITRAGSSISLNRIDRGDHIVARYRVTDQGLMLISGRSPTSAPTGSASTPAASAMLPKTAGDAFLYLLLGLGLLGGAGGLRYARHRTRA